ncbi:hypothetical protein [Clostridium algidicarnis]|uniref:hypothetical protein n=1 Tax=Clostridium algidicarnis TaxID=37659 RepID=UPI000496ED14|nr:hypothetical protein [Clostridium algidicarnis]
MVTICIDESGNFEKKEYLKKFIGGVVYVGEDCEDEEKRLDGFFKKQCELFSLDYPRGIHTTEMNSNKTNSEGKSIKEKIIENLKIYLRENGKYHFTCLIKSRTKRKDYVNVSNIVDDDNASNLYEHMVRNLIFNLVFYTSDVYNDSEVNLNIATRSIPIKSYQKEEIEKYTALGYSKKSINNGERYIFYLTDIKTFKAAIGTKMMERRIAKPINFNMNVKSIDYNNSVDTMPYLYLADFACDIIRDMLDNNELDFGVKVAGEELNNITGREFLLWAYDDIDTISSRLVSKFGKRDVMGALNEIYNINESCSTFKEYYLKHWSNPIEKRLSEIFDKNKMNIYISELSYLLSKDMVQYKKGLFIALKLWEVIQIFNEGGKDDKAKVEKVYIYRLADLIGRGYNHLGNSEGSKKYFDICIENKDEVDIEEYLTTINRIVEIDANEFNFDVAIEKLKPSLLGLDLWKDTKKEVAELMGLEKQRASCLIIRGKALSSIAQFYAFNRNKEESLKHFEEALVEFENNKGQRLITISYMLHLALDMEDINLYKKYEVEYFGTKDLKQQFKNIIKLNNENNPNDYMLFVYIKALNIFYSDKIEQRFIERIQTINYEEYGFKTNEHPWELIFKHLAILQYKNGNINRGNKLVKKAQEAIAHGEITIKLINLCTSLDAFEYTKDIKGQKKILEQVEKLCRTNKVVQEQFKDILEEKDQYIRGKNILSKFTFMYA